MRAPFERFVIIFVRIHRFPPEHFAYGIWRQRRHIDGSHYLRTNGTRLAH